MNPQDIQGQNQLEMFISTDKLMQLSGNGIGQDSVDLKGNEG